jgi:hypothetical protein
VREETKDVTEKVEKIGKTVRDVNEEFKQMGQ